MDGDGVDLVLWWWCSGFRGFRGFRSLQEMHQELRMYIYSVDFHCDKRRRDMTSGYVMGRGGELWQLIGDDLNRPMPGRRARIAVTWWSGISMTAPDHHRCGLLGVPLRSTKDMRRHEKCHRTWNGHEGSGWFAHFRCSLVSSAVFSLNEWHWTVQRCTKIVTCCSHIDP